MGQSRRRGAAGFTMLEALVAIVILAFGVLGVANLLIKSFRFAQQSSYDIVALQLANDMAERMRANDAIARNNGYDPFDTANGAPAVGDAGNLYKVECTAGTAPAGCPTMAANFDKATWARRVQSSLPGGRAVICRDSTAFNLASGYSWNCNGATGNENIPLVVKIGWVSRFADRPGTDVAEGTTMTDSQGAGAIATPQIVVIVNPGADS